MKVLVLSDVSSLGLKVVHCLAHAGHEVHVLSNISVDLGWSRHVRSCEAWDWHDRSAGTREFPERLLSHCRRLGVEAVVPSCIGTSELLHGLPKGSDEPLIFPVSPPSLLEDLHDKWRFFRLMKSLGIRTPDTELLIEPGDVTRPSVAQRSYPAVVKPLSAESSHGVRVVGDLEQLRRHIGSGSRYAKMPLILQEYVSGRDIGVSVYAQEGQVRLYTIQCWENTVSDRSMVFTDAHPALEMAMEITARTGYTGVAHFDMRQSNKDQSVYVLECNPRFWFSLNASLWHGVNFVDGPIRLLLGESSTSQLMARYQTGRYYLNGSLVRAFRSGRVRLPGLRWANVRSLMQAMTDPMPALYGSFSKRRKQRPA